MLDRDSKFEYHIFSLIVVIFTVSVFGEEIWNKAEKDSNQTLRKLAPKFISLIDKYNLGRQRL